jgi:hypothetical protein
VTGNKLTLTIGFPAWFNFLKDIFGISLFTEISPAPTFYGANGLHGFPDVTVDTSKVTTNGKRLNYVERFAGADSGRVFYRYMSDPFDTAADGKPVGLSAVNPAFKAYYFSFPLYDLDSLQVKALLDKVLAEFEEVPTGVASESRPVPSRFKLYDAFPNPFNPVTSIRYDLPEASEVSIVIYDMLGRELAQLVNEHKPAGEYSVVWNASQVSSGLYFCRFIAHNNSSGTGASFIRTSKLLLLK